MEKLPRRTALVLHSDRHISDSEQCWVATNSFCERINIRRIASLGLSIYLLFRQEFPLGLHLLRHRVVLVHGPHPKADGRARLGSLLDLLGLKVGVDYEGVDRLTRSPRP